MSIESEEFEAIINAKAQNNDMQVVSFLSHPDDDDKASELIQIINKAGGAKEIWKPIMFGIVTEVEDYWLTDEQRSVLNTTIKHEQKVTWVSTTGYKFIRGWNDQKQLNKDIDLTDFPDGFKKLDCIRVEASGAVVKSIKRVSIRDIKVSLGLEEPEMPPEISSE